jgi:hypothetical protein
MADTNVDHWRNLQALLLESAKEKRRIVIIHEQGKILKFVHTQRLELVKSIAFITNPHEAARQIYFDNPGKADFVAVFERNAFDEYFGKCEGSWNPNEDLDVYVSRMYAMLDNYPDGMVTYPGPARTKLGLQWRLGASYEDVIAAAKRFIPPKTTAVFGVFSGDTLWTSLVLSFDENGKANVVTTVDPTELKGGTWRETADEMVKWSNKKFQPCSLGLFVDVEGTSSVLTSSDKLVAFREIAQRGRLLVAPKQNVLPSII